MKRLLSAFVLTATVATFPAIAANIGMSVQVGEPGFFGRIDIGRAPPPPVIYQQPVVIHAPPVQLEREPVYLHVPPEHARHWRRYCRQYNACGERVYFVQDSWYRDEYVPRYREQHARGRDEERRDDGRREEERRDEGRRDEREHRDERRRQN